MLLTIYHYDYPNYNIPKLLLENDIALYLLYHYLYHLFLLLNQNRLFLYLYLLIFYIRFYSLFVLALDLLSLFSFLLFFESFFRGLAIAPLFAVVFILFSDFLSSDDISLNITSTEGFYFIKYFFRFLSE